MTSFTKRAVVLALVLAALVIIAISAGKIGLPAAPASGKLARMNSLMVIVPYKYEGMWVFDDPQVGLQKEPFIAGIDTLIDKATADIPDAQHGFRAIFSAAPFSARTSNCNGVAQNPAAIGILVGSLIRKAGFALLS
jgi:hypothetical protein